MATITPYQPVSCELHSQFELLAMHGTPCRLKLKSAQKPEILTGQITDIITRDKAEYLILKDSEGKTRQVRLDDIDTVLS